MLPSQIKNKGYWKVNGVEFDNKIRAVLSAQQQNLGPSNITYHYNDTWWDQHDWSVEPNESLDQLYLRRAKQLRETYDTLILRFSGGSDSVNILKTFVDNNIKLDVVVMSVWALGDPDNTIVPNNIEKVKLAFPMIEQLQAQGTELKVFVSDSSQLMSTLGDDLEWFLKIDAPRFSVIDITAHQIATVPELSQWNNPRTGCILGVDKPQVWCKHEKIWYSKLNDVLHTMHTKCNEMIPEPFYWTADMPEITIKQSHVVKNFYQKNQHLMESSITDPTTKSIVGKKSRLIPLIYPRYFDDVDLTKESLPYYDMTDHGQDYRREHGLGPQSPRGMGSDTLVHLSPYYKIWRDGIDHADSMIDRRFKNLDTIWQGGLIQLYTKPRWLGK